MLLEAFTGLGKYVQQAMTRSNVSCTPYINLFQVFCIVFLTKFMFWGSVLILIYDIEPFWTVVSHYIYLVHIHSPFCFTVWVCILSAFKMYRTYELGLFMYFNMSHNKVNATLYSYLCFFACFVQVLVVMFITE